MVMDRGFHILSSRVNSQYLQLSSMKDVCPVPTTYHYWPHPFFKSIRKQRRECFMTEICSYVLKSLSRPSAVLASRKKRLCEVCTTDPLHPMMFDEEREWTPHCKSRSHQRLVKRKAREPEIALRRAKSAGEERSGASLFPRPDPCDPMTKPA